MRNYKFRGWDAERKDWLNEKDVYAQLENQARWNPEVGDTYILMQSTGLKDKNGKEIFESDILKVRRSFENQEFIGVVVWDDVKARFMFENDFEKTGLWRWDLPNFKILEVVGNLHEHPALLKDER